VEQFSRDELYQKDYKFNDKHKISGEKGNEAHVGVHVYSSKNLTTWNDEGVL
jgi:hypothetical protein